MNDPEIQQILQDPSMQVILEQMQKDPAAAQEWVLLLIDFSLLILVDFSLINRIIQIRTGWFYHMFLIFVTGAAHY